MINLDASAFAEKITEKDVVLLDVRTVDEFSQSHIPNALNIDVQGDYFTADISALDKSKVMQFTAGPVRDQYLHLKRWTKLV